MFNFAAMKTLRVLIFSVIGMSFFSCKQNGPVADVPGTPPFNDSAVKSLSIRISKEPKNAKLYFERGNLLQRMHEDSLALNDYKQAARLDSSKAEYFSAIGDLMFEHKDVEGSVPFIEKAVKLNPRDPKARMKIAKLFVFIKEYPKAFSEINTVLRQNAMVPEGYFLKGLIYKDIKDTAKAISSFQTALQIDPNYRDAMLQLGSIYSAQKNPLAVTYYDNAMKTGSKDVFPLYAKGMYYQEQEEYEKAKQAYREAINQDREYSKAIFGMGFILMQQDSLEKAKRQFDLVSQLEPTNDKAYYNRGLCSELLGNTNEALEDYRQALNFNPDYKEASEGIKRLSR